MKLIRTAAELLEAVTFGKTTESLHLEFKRSAPGPLPKGVNQQVLSDAQMELVADIIQFANAEGGCVLYGVEEGQGATPGFKVATAVASIQKPDELKQWIEQATRNYAVPATFSKDVVIIDTTQGVVVAVNVPPSRYLVSLWDDDRHTVKYPKRTSHGLDWMNPDEAERHIMDGSRAARLAMIEASKDALNDGYGGFVVELTDSCLLDWGPGTERQRMGHQGLQVSISKIRDYSFDLKVVSGGSHYALSLPYGAVREAWATPQRKVGLMLHVVLIVPHDEKRVMWFEPR